MSDRQVWLVAITFLILLLITLVVQFGWLKQGRVKTILVFLSGVAAIASLRMAGIPPDWFSGSKTGFGLVLSLGLWAFVLRGDEERSFGRPLLMGMALTLLATNVIEAAAGAL